MTLSGEQVFQTYENWMLRRRDPSSVRGYRHAWASFLAYVADPVAPQDIQDWIDDTTWAPSTMRTAYSWIKAGYTHCVERDLIERSPCRKWITVDPPDDSDPTYYSPSELARFEAGCRDTDDELLLRLFTHTGMRSIEVRRLTWDKIEDGAMHVHGKGGKWRYVPVHPDLHDSLRAAQMRSPFVVSTERGALSESGLRLRIQRITGVTHKHGFRSTVATDLLMHEVPEATINQIIGHGPKSMFQKHYNAKMIPTMRTALLTLYT